MRKRAVKRNRRNYLQLFNQIFSLLGYCRQLGKSFAVTDGKGPCQYTNAAESSAFYHLNTPIFWTIILDYVCHFSLSFSEVDGEPSENSHVTAFLDGCGLKEVWQQIFFHIEQSFADFWILIAESVFWSPMLPLPLSDHSSRLLALYQKRVSNFLHEPIKVLSFFCATLSLDHWVRKTSIKSNLGFWIHVLIVNASLCKCDLTMHCDIGLLIAQ